MLTIRNVFTAKPGMASKLAKQLHGCWNKHGFRVFTDAVGDMNTVVLEHDAKDYAEIEALFKRYGSDADIKKAMEGYTDLYLTGRRELLQSFKP
jgi:hypothetical protein